MRYYTKAAFDQNASAFQFTTLKTFVDKLASDFLG